MNENVEYWKDKYKDMKATNFLLMYVLVIVATALFSLIMRFNLSFPCLLESLHK